MSLAVGLGGATRNGCVAVCTPQRVVGICEQERITRVRAAGFNPSGLPDEALDELLRRSARSRGEVTTIAVAEEVPALAARNRVRVDHHFAHACSAFLPSPFESATVVICDHEWPQVSVWDGDGTTIARVDWPWQGEGFAELYSQCAETLGFAAGGHEQRMEALARLGCETNDQRAVELFGRDGDRLRIAPNWRSRVEDWIRGGDLRHRSLVAAALQSRIRELLIDFISEVRKGTGGRRQLCVGGSLFHNTYVNSGVKLTSGFEDVYVPINPGNAGLALGLALHANQNLRLPVSPFQGPAYSDEEIKGTIDNCKLTYQWASEPDTIAIAVDALNRGRLVAWFDGPMESGARALGARSILANPFMPYALDNLNRFLKEREAWRGYALSGLESCVGEMFEGPQSSHFMECDYAPKDRGRFRHILPEEAATVRVQSVASDAPARFRALLESFGDSSSSGLPILVNTSFNGFREPIVCSPRDAIRVFFGTGLDMMVLGHFVISKVV